MAIIPGQVNQNIIIDTPQKQRNKKLAFLLVSVIILTSLIIYFGFGGQPASPPAAIKAITPDEQQIDENSRNLSALNAISLNSPLFTDKKFQSLILSDQLPVAVGIKGRSDPFLPF